MAELLNPITQHLKLQFENIEHVIPARVSYLTIFNPTFSKDDTEAGLIEQILCYVQGSRTQEGEQPGEGQSNDSNVKLRQIGLIQGIDSFAREFSQNKPISYIDTEQTRIIVEKVEKDYYIVACIELTKLTDNDDASDEDDSSATSKRADSRSKSSNDIYHKNGIKVEYSTAHLAPAVVLCQDIKNAYNFFKLHYGSFASIIRKQSLNALKNMLDGWWGEYIQRWDLSVNNKGFLKLLDGYKLSSKSISFSNSSNIKNVNLITEKLSEFFQLNSSKLIDMLIFSPLDLSALLKHSNSSNSDGTIYGTNSGTNATMGLNGDINSSENKVRVLIEEYGIVFKGFDIISNESLVNIFNWLEGNNFAGIQVSNLLSDNMPKNVSIDQDSLLSDNYGLQDDSVYFNPFSTTFNTLTSFFGAGKDRNERQLALAEEDRNNLQQNATRRTEQRAQEGQVGSLNLMLKQISDKKEITRGQYLIGLREKQSKSAIATPNISAHASPNPDRILNSPCNNSDISFKPICIRLAGNGQRENALESQTVSSTSHSSSLSGLQEEDLECSLVLYEIGGLIFVLIFEKDYEELNTIMFYEQLEENILELFEATSEFFCNNSTSKKANNKNAFKKIGTSNDKTISSTKSDKDFMDYLSLKSFLLPFGMYFNNSEDKLSGGTDNNKNQNQNSKTMGDYLRNHIEEDTQKLEKYKSTFYYIVYVPELNFYQTSLPIIPKPENVLLGNASADERKLSDSGFLDPRYTFDLQVSRTQALHLHNQLIGQFDIVNGASDSVSEKLVNTEKFWWIYYNKFGGAKGKGPGLNFGDFENFNVGDAKRGVNGHDSVQQHGNERKSTPANYYETHNYERQVFVLKKFSSTRKSRNLLFTDKSEDFLSMLGDNVKIWFDNCISTGRV